MKLSEINTTWDLAKECQRFQGRTIWYHYIRLKIKRFDSWTTELLIVFGNWIRLDKVLKVTTDKAIKNQEQEEIIERTVKNVVGEEYKVIILSEGMDIAPIEGSYYGLYKVSEGGGWVVNNNGEIISYPCRAIAEAHAQKHKDLIVKSFNDLEELTANQIHLDYKHTANEQLQPARSYIKENIDPKYAKKLLKGVETYIKYIGKVNYHEFKVTDLASNLNEIAKQRGVGTVSINALRDQLKADGWL